MPDVSLVTCADLPDGDEDAAALVSALADLGVTARFDVWDDAGVDWSTDLAVLRSTWDYTRRRNEFLAWTRSVPRVANRANLVAWNSDKVYLRDLSDAGVPVVPTTFAAPGDAVHLPPMGEFVVKPSVGAGSRGAGRFAVDSSRSAFEHAVALHAAGRTVLIQPYLADVDTAGESALIYLDGQFSHAANKRALLPESTVHALHGAELFIDEVMRPHTASAAERAVADHTLAVVVERFDSVPLYARVDLLPSAEGPRVIEFEAIEPSLFLSYDPGAPTRFAAAIAGRL